MLGNLNYDFAVLFLLFFEEFYFLKRYSTFTINPFSVNKMIVTHVDHLRDTADIAVSNETETTWFLGPLFFYDHTVLKMTELKKIGTELF